jgi:hypothetical protein
MIVFQAFARKNAQQEQNERLFTAIKKEDFAGIRQLLGSGASVKAVGGDKSTIFHFLNGRFDAETADLIFKKLSQECNDDKAEMARVLNARDGFGMSALMNACNSKTEPGGHTFLTQNDKNKIHIIGLMLENGSDARAIGNEHMSVLSYALPMRATTIKSLGISKKNEPLRLDYSHVSAGIADLVIFDMLLKAGANPEGATTYGFKSLKAEINAMISDYENMRKEIGGALGPGDRALIKEIKGLMKKSAQ